MNIGNNIKKIRKEKGLQQKQVALELGLDQSNYNKIENSKREPSIDVLNKLANLFGVSVDDILNPDKELPKEVTVEDKTTLEHVITSYSIHYTKLYDNLQHIPFWFL